MDRDAAKIRASSERKQKTDRRDAELLVKLLDEDRFPRSWVPTPRERDTRQLLLHRHKPVAPAHAGEEPVASAGVEPGRATEVEAVERGRAETVGEAGAVGVGESTQGVVAEAA